MKLYRTHVKIIKKFILNYEQPEVEIVEVAIEKGFAGSPEDTIDPGAGNPDIEED